MTIKQQGGIFGRNPTFQDVTIEGSLSFDGAVDVTTDLTIDGTLTADGLAINDGTSLLARTSSGAEIDVLEVRNNATATSTASAIKFVNSTATGSNSGSTELVAIRTGTNTGDFKIRTSNSSATMTDRMLIGSNGNISISAGNLVVASGQGIDFSATSDAAGATSELFDDYEEGSFTPTITSAGTAPTVTYSSQTGTYTKVGNRVHVDIYISTSAYTAGTGNFRIAGLPFTAASGAEGGAAPMGFKVNTGAEARLKVEGGDTVCQMLTRGTRDTSTAWGNAQSSIWGTANPTILTVSFTYVAA